MKAIVIVGHGSKQKGFEAPMEKVAKRLRRDKRFNPIVCAYLEITSPSIPQAIDRCVRKGAGEIDVLPYFLLSGRHVESDIPKIVVEAKKKYHRRVKIKLCPYLGYHEKIVGVVKERLLQAK